MTVIAWDGRLLAADRMSVRGGTLYTTRKVWRVPQGLMAYTGDADHCASMLEWFRSGRLEAKFPEVKDSTGSGLCLLVAQNGSLLVYERTPHPVPVFGPFVAYGIGRDGATAAMMLGKTAVEAVAMACEINEGCGRGINAMELFRDREWEWPTVPDWRQPRGLLELLR